MKAELEEALPSLAPAVQLETRGSIMRLEETITALDLALAVTAPDPPPVSPEALRRRRTAAPQVERSAVAASLALVCTVCGRPRAPQKRETCSDR